MRVRNFMCHTIRMSPTGRDGDDLERVLSIGGQRTLCVDVPLPSLKEEHAREGLLSPGLLLAVLRRGSQPSLAQARSRTPLSASATQRRRMAVSEGARETPRLRLEVERLDVFDEDRIPIVCIRRTPELSAALTDIRSRAEAAELPGYEDRIAPADCVFHPTIVYYEGDRWPGIDATTRSISVPPAVCVADEAELVGFDGGPERLLGRFSLQG